ncbi:unnamed protein product, partial [marine sediment metagenome]
IKYFESIGARTNFVTRSPQYINITISKAN